MKRGFLFSCLAMLLAACATSPTGRTQFMMFSEATAIASSKQAYAQLLAPLSKEGKIDTDALLRDRVMGMTSRVVAQAVRMRPETANWEWEIKIINDPKTVNAWAMAGGKMALYTGLVEQLKPSDDELAQVIGHEIAHALAKHSAEKMSIAAATKAGITAVAIASDQSQIAITGAALTAAVALTLPSSRTMESEADEIGIELAAKAGYNPNAAVTLWEKMRKVGGGAPPQFLSTHPNPAARKQTLQELVPQMMPYYQSRGARPSHPL